MEALKLIPYIFLVLAIAGIIAGASMISVGQFGDSMDKCWNASFEYNETLAACINTTSYVGDALGEDNLNFTDEYFAMVQVKGGMGDVAEQFPTIGIISVMVIIISLIAGVFVYMKFFA